MSNESIPGYDRGAEGVPAPPITMDDFTTSEDGFDVCLLFKSVRAV